jgi:hypothetical protein
MVKRVFASAVALTCLASSCMGFITPAAPKASTTALAAKSKAVPFLDAPKSLDGTLAGDVGFDPLGLSDIQFDFSYLIVPTKWDEKRTGLSTVKWMAEAEIKHCRFAMLAVAGWLATEFGVRFPGADRYNGISPVAAHDTLVKSGDLTVALLIIGFLEVIGGVGIYEMSKGSDRQPGEFGFDPLNLGADKSRRARYQLSEIKNGRLAMLAFGGIATQAVLTGKGFPYM